MPRKALLVRFQEERYHDLKEAVAYLRTDLTAFINKVVEKEVNKVLQKRNLNLIGDK